jgi:anti-anti-sigma factor
MIAAPGTAPLMLVTADDDEHASIVWAIGELDESTVGAFEAECMRVGSGSRFLIIELSSCSLLTSAGLRALVHLQRRFPAAIALVIDHAQFERLFFLAGLGQLLPRFTNVVDAMALRDDDELRTSFGRASDAA